MNPQALLDLIADLYSQIVLLRARIQELEAERGKA